MPKSGPIIIIEDDDDDQEVLKELFKELRIQNLVRFFDSCFCALDYLLTTIEKPFLIISDINLPMMTGIELKKKINENEVLQKKCIPFVFFSTTSDAGTIIKAYEVLAQGYFVKPVKISDLKEMLSTIICYWHKAAIPVYN